MMEGQVKFAPNGNIMPCPFTEDCLNHPTGCDGISYWCGRFDTVNGRKMMRKAKEDRRAYESKSYTQGQAHLG